MVTILYKVENPKPTGYLRNVKTYNHIFIRFNEDYFFTIWDYFKITVSPESVKRLPKTTSTRLLKYYVSRDDVNISDIKVLYEPDNVVDMILNLYPVILLGAQNVLQKTVEQNGVYSLLFQKNIKYNKQVLSHIINSYNHKLDSILKQGTDSFIEFMTKAFTDYYTHYAWLKRSVHNYFEVPLIVGRQVHGVFIIKSSEGHFVPSERVMSMLRFTPYIWAFSKVIEGNDFDISTPYYVLNPVNIQYSKNNPEILETVNLQYLFPRGIETKIIFDILLRK